MRLNINSPITKSVDMSSTAIQTNVSNANIIKPVPALGFLGSSPLKNRDNIIITGIIGKPKFQLAFKPPKLAVGNMIYSRKGMTPKEVRTNLYQDFNVDMKEF